MKTKKINGLTRNFEKIKHFERKIEVFWEICQEKSQMEW